MPPDRSQPRSQRGHGSDIQIDSLVRRIGLSVPVEPLYDNRDDT